MTLFTCGYLQTRTNCCQTVEGDIYRPFSDWPEKETKLCPAHLTFLSVFIGKEVELVSGISLCTRFKGPEGLY